MVHESAGRYLEGDSIRGALIVFEGAEGVGKSTQAKRLAVWLADSGVPCLALREPGGTPLGEEVRKLLLDPSVQIEPAAEALLFMASRAELLARRVRPALEAGQAVILDRFFLSTYAYQIAGRGLSESHIREANQLAIGSLVPHITFVLDLSVDDGLSRADARGARDRMERADDAFHRRVSDAFRTYTTAEWQAQHSETGLIIRIDASGTEDEVFQRIVDALTRSLPGVMAKDTPHHV